MKIYALAKIRKRTKIFKKKKLDEIPVHRSNDSLSFIKNSSDKCELVERHRRAFNK